MRIAIVDKCPSKIDYKKHYGLEAEVFHLASTQVKRLLKRDVDLSNFNPKDFDFVILVGSEAAKFFTKVTAVSDMTGQKVPGNKDYADYENFIISISPAMTFFKPENKPVLDSTVEMIHAYVNGTNKEQVPCEYRLITDPTEAEEYIEFLLNYKSDLFAIDSETTALYARDGYVLGISLSHKEHQGVYIDSDCLTDKAIDTLQQALNTKRYVGHNLKFDQKFLEYHLGLTFPLENMEDSMLLHYILDERRGTHGLKPLALKYTDMGDYDAALDDFRTEYCKTHGIAKDDFNYGMIPFEILGQYAARDSDAALRIFNIFRPLVAKNPRLEKLYKEVLLPASNYLAKVEDRGIPISSERLFKAQEILAERIDLAKKKLYSFDEVKRLEADQGEIFNPGSTKQLRALLFDYVKLQPTGKLTGTGAISTDAEVLMELAEEHPVPAVILEVRKLTKLKNTYVDKLIPAIDRDGRVRTGFNLIGTTSGRLSSSGKFNAQQLPRDDALIKGCIKAKEGYRIVAVDMTTAEVWVAAALSGDKNLQAVFRDKSGADLHSIIAHMVFGLNCEPTEVKKVYPYMRQAAKAIK